MTFLQLVNFIISFKIALIVCNASNDLAPRCSSHHSILLAKDKI